MSWILIIWCLGLERGAIDHIEFKSKADCEAVMFALKEETKSRFELGIRGVCVGVTNESE